MTRCFSFLLAMIVPLGVLAQPEVTTAEGEGEIAVSTERIVRGVESGESVSAVLTIQNRGNGALAYNVRFRATDGGGGQDAVFTSRSRDQIVRRDPFTYEQVSYFDLPSSLRHSGDAELAFDGSRLYYNRGSDDQTFRLSPQTGAVLDTLDLPGDSDVQGLAVEGNRLYAVAAGRVVAYELKGLAELASWTVPDPFVWRGALAAGDGRVYTTAEGSAQYHILVADVEADSLVRVIPIGGTPGPFNASRSLAYLNGELYVGVGDDVVVLDAETGAEVRRFERSVSAATAAGGGLVTWASASPASATLAPGSSVSVALSLDASDLYAGSYTADLVIASDDPDRPEVVVPVKLGVTGTPDARIFTTPVEFGRVFVGQRDVRSIEVENEGTASLRFGALASGDPAITLTASSAVVPPEGRATIEVELLAAQPGAISTTLVIPTNDPEPPSGEVRVSASAEVLPAPRAVLSAEPVSATVRPGETTTLPVEVRNDGASPLTVFAAGREGDGSSAAIYTPDYARSVAVRRDLATGDSLGSVPLPSPPGRGVQMAYSGSRLLISWHDFDPARFFEGEVVYAEINPATGETLRSWSQMTGPRPVFDLAYDGDVAHSIRSVDFYGLVTRFAEDGSPEGYIGLEGDSVFPYNGIAFGDGRYFVAVFDGPGSRRYVVEADPETGEILDELVSGNGPLAYAEGRLIHILGGEALARFYDPDTGEALVGFSPVRTRSIAAGGRYVPWIASAKTTVEPGATATLGVGIDASALAVGTYEATLALTTNDPAARSTLVPVSLVVTTATDAEADVPVVFGLDAVAPNPVAGAGRVTFRLAHASDVSLDVFDALGRRVATLAEGPHAAGTHTARLAPGTLAAGAYVLRLATPDERASRRFIVTR